MSKAMMTTQHSHSVSRTIRAEPEAIYQAFMNPDVLARWLPPDGATGQIEVFEAHVGGRLRMTLTFRDSQGKSSENTDTVEARFVDLTGGQRIGLSVEFISDDPRYAGVMTMTWLLRPQPQGTTVTVTADHVPVGIDRTDHEVAMASTLANLARTVESAVKTE